MITKELFHTVFCLHQNGKSNRSIAKMLKISRNSVKKLLKQEDYPIPKMRPQETEVMPVLPELFERCLGNAVRIQEVLQQDYQFEIAYSTLTRLIQHSGLRTPPRRVGEYHFEPGEEMQHDTSPHWVRLGDVKTKAQCASLVFAYSRKIFIQYYPRFTRFEAKSFLKAAFTFMQGSCHRCVIDNTNVILSGGSGPNAVIAPEMLNFCRMFGFEFMAHRINHADRKARVERPFYYIETNFLAGRSFKEWDDLNHQAEHWCRAVNQKEKRILGMTPDSAYLQEKPYLIPLPEILPPIYEHYQRIVDSKGFVNVDSNRYSVSERLIGKTVDVYKYLEKICIFHQGKEMGVHSRLMGKRQTFSRLPGHHTKSHERQTHQAANQLEAALRGYHQTLDLYLDAFKKQVHGHGTRQLNRLLNFKRTYPKEALSLALKKALHYGLYDLNRVEDLIIKSVAGNYFNLGEF